MKKFKHILEGIYNYFFFLTGIPNKKLEERARKRLDICAACILKNETTAIPYCEECGCILQWKSRSSSECELGYWKNGVSKQHQK